jgi:hypothetical protein
VTSALFDLMRGVAAWLNHLTTIETAFFVMALWISATIASVLLHYGNVTRRGLGAATLMYGSFVMSTLMIGLILYAGFSA